MRYLCLIYREEPPDAARPRPSQEDGERHAVLARGGQLLVAGALHAAETVATIHLRDDGPEVGAGACVADGAWLDAFALLEARDLNDAIRVAAKLPTGGASYIEIRSVAGGTAGRWADAALHADCAREHR